MKEIERNMLDPKVAKGKDAVNLAALHQNVDNIAGLNMKDKIDPRIGGIVGGGDDAPPELKKADVEKFADLAKQPNPFKKFEKELAMSKIARNFDNFKSDPKEPTQMTPGEVDTALKRGDLTTTQKQALQDLRKHQENLLTKKYKSSYKDGDGKEYVSDDDPKGAFQSYTQRDRAGNLNQRDIAGIASDEARTLSSVFDCLDSAGKRLADAAKPENKDRMSQGTDGSCFFLAPLIAMNGHDPKALDKMVEDNGDGTHTVTFPGDPKNPVTVGKPTDAEMANWANGTKAAIFEKALGERYDKMYPRNKDDERPSSETTSLIPSARIQGGQTKDAWKLLTGKDAVEFDNKEKSETQLRDFLKKSAGSPMAADTLPHQPASTGLVGRHSYSIKYDEKTDSIRFENPVKPTGANDNNSSYPHEPHRIDGSALDGKNDGAFSMKVSEASKYLWRVVKPGS